MATIKIGNNCISVPCSPFKKWPQHPPINFQVVVSNKQILRIALPISVAILVPQINFITNNIFLGGLNEESLAAAGITGVFYLVFAVIGNGLNNGLQALIARRAGENRIDEIGKKFFPGHPDRACVCNAGYFNNLVYWPAYIKIFPSIGIFAEAGHPLPENTDLGPSFSLPVPDAQCIAGGYQPK